METRPHKHGRYNGKKGSRATGHKPHGDTSRTGLPWDQFRPYIEKRYIEDNLALPDLMKEMKERGFVATWAPLFVIVAVLRIS